jgi:hypothetical protein
MHARCRLAAPPAAAAAHGAGARSTRGAPMSFAALLLRRSGAEHRFLAQKRLREGALRSARERAARAVRRPKRVGPLCPAASRSSGSWAPRPELGNGDDVQARRRSHVCQRFFSPRRR